MPYNQQMTFPCDLTLRRQGRQPRQQCQLA
jgi:hypothetical protein